MIVLQKNALAENDIGFLVEQVLISGIFIFATITLLK